MTAEILEESMWHIMAKGCRYVCCVPLLIMSPLYGSASEVEFINDKGGSISGLMPTESFTCYGLWVYSKLQAIGDFAYTERYGRHYPCSWWNTLIVSLLSTTYANADLNDGVSEFDLWAHNHWKTPLITPSFIIDIKYVENLACTSLFCKFLKKIKEKKQGFI